MDATYTLGQQIALRAVFGALLTEVSDRAQPGTDVINLRDASGYAAADLVMLGAGADNEEIVTIATVTGAVLELTAPLRYQHQPDESAMLLADPTTVTLRLHGPHSEIVSYTYAGAMVTKTALGQFVKLVTPAESGDYLARWEGTGTVVTAAERGFRVAASVFR